jgi:CrcB protein
VGFFITLVFERVATVPSKMRLMVATGFLGDYTTFSTYGLETNVLLHALTALSVFTGLAVLY